MLNATWLETFTVLAETGHFTRAARQLNMTQPGVSQHLRKLEAQVGQPLIAQDGKSFALTAAGEAVVSLGRSRRAEERRLMEQIETDDPDAGEVRIACSGSFATLLYPKVLDVMEKAPRLQVHLEAAPKAAVLSGVLEMRFDLGIVGGDPNHPRVQAQRIGTEELCLVLPETAPDGLPTFQALEDRGFVAHPDGHAYADDLFSLNFPEAFRGADRLRQRTYINQIGQIPEPVARGIGYTLLPRSGVEAFPRKHLLRIAPLEHRRHQDLWLIAKRGRPLGARFDRMVDIMKRIAGSLGGGP